MCSLVSLYPDCFGCKLTPPHSIVKEVITPNANYCTLSFHIGPMLAIYTSIPIMCFDILLVILAVVTLVKHFMEQRSIKMRPNTYMVMIVRYHILYFAL